MDLHWNDIMTVEDSIGAFMTGQARQTVKNERGYMMAALLVSLAVMSVLMTVALPTWRHMMQREREAELVFRGEQYARAVGLFQRKYAGAFPPSVDMLVQQKFLRKKYRDPMVPDGDFQILYQTATAQPGVGQPVTGGFGQTPGEDQGATPGLQPGRPPSAGPGTGSSTTPGQIGSGAGRAIGTLGPRGGVIGVVSKSPARSIRVYRGRSKYNEWQFLYTDVRQNVGVPGSQGPGAPGGPGPAGPGRPSSQGRGPGSRPGAGSFPPGGGQRAPGPGMPPSP
jgi:type II secretory pathway pseudopilin PulG